MGTTVLLTALVAAIGGAIGLGTETTPTEAADAAAQNTGAVTVGSAIVIGLVLLIGYFAGGYVAGRMARFSGAKQGIAVWLWAIIIAIVVAIITAIAGAQWDILSTLQGFPRIPVTPETATTTGILTALGAAIITLVGAVLGGLAGMRYHRKVDRVGLGR
jgi:heme/copper-type cytochrome/quinol oxidase subunit 2